MWESRSETNEGGFTVKYWGMTLSILGQGNDQFGGGGGELGCVKKGWGGVMVNGFAWLIHQ